MGIEKGEVCVSMCENEGAYFKAGRLDRNPSPFSLHDGA